MILLITFSFLAGLATILAPCIWPVLPIVLSSSVGGGGGHRRPLGITLGVMISFTIFTLTAATLVRVFHLDPNVLRTLAVIVITFLGLTMIFPALATQFETLLSRLANIFSKSTEQKQGSGFLPGFITGCSLGIVWSPCAGPILATIATLAATGNISIAVVAVTLAYVTGVGVPLFAFAYGGQRFIARARSVNRYTGMIQRVFGGVMILAAFAIFTGYDQRLQIGLLDRFPALGTAVNGFENNSAVTGQLNALKGTTSSTIPDTTGLWNAHTKAPDFVGITHWLNTDKPISIADLHGKVVLVDFWTYTCINCIRTLPFTTSWYEKYKDQGFVVIGVHTPEFQFEHETGNVENAIRQYGIHYPVAQDNNYATWTNYRNEYWPAEYLIDANGTIRRTHFGEGEYDQMEQAIQALLGEAGKQVPTDLVSMPDQTPTGTLSPETYLGSNRMQYYSSPSGNIGNGTKNLTLSDNPGRNRFSYGGQWTISDEYATTGDHATLDYDFSAGKVFIILRPGDTAGGTVRVSLDGNPIDPSVAGADVKNSTVTVDTDRLYNVVDLHGKTERHILKLEFQTPGLQAFTFTFG